MSDPANRRARPVGINHVAVEVGDVDEALEFYGALLEFDLRGRTDSSAFVDLGDQFVALAETDATASADAGSGHRHFGLVVDDPSAVERRLEELDAGAASADGPDFRDPWGNRVQVVAYEEVQFTKAGHVLRGMGLDGLTKTDSAVDELSEKGMAPE